MKDINYIILVGRVANEVIGSDLSYTNNGTACLKITIASNDSVKKGGSWEEEVSYFDVIIWGKSAEKLQPFLKKGKQLAVSGRLQQQRWKSKEGTNRSRIVVVAETVQLLGGRGEGSPKKYEETESARETFIDDIPF